MKCGRYHTSTQQTQFVQTHCRGVFQSLIFTTDGDCPLGEPSDIFPTLPGNSLDHLTSFIPSAWVLQQHTSPGENLTHPTACGNDSLDGPSNREKWSFQQHTSTYSAVPLAALVACWRSCSTSSIEKKCLCQLHLYIVHIISHCISVLKTCIE